MEDPTIRSASIFVSELRLQARVGVNPGEQGAEQPIEVDLWVWVDDMARAARSEQLRHTLDYVGMARIARKVVQRRHYPLVETLATTMARALLELRGARRARVRLRKLDCLRRASSAGVEVELDREITTSCPPPVAPAEVHNPEDVLVLGGGAAGLSAALWCWRLGHPALVLDRAARLGGQLHQVHGQMTDLPGTSPMDGRSLSRRLWHQFSGHDGRWLQAGLTAVEQSPHGLVARLSGSDGPLAVEARAVILALGIRRRRLQVPGERRLAGRGLLATAARDPGAHAGRPVVVVGGGDAACENALILARVGAHVLLVHRGRRLECLLRFRREVEQHGGITLRLQSTVQRFVGQQALEAVELEGPDGVEQVPATAALVRIGWMPNSDGLPGKWLDPEGFVRVSHQGQVVGQQRVFAAGDLTHPTSSSVANAFGAGATAARAAISELERTQQ